MDRERLEDAVPAPKNGSPLCAPGSSGAGWAGDNYLPWMDGGVSLTLINICEELKIMRVSKIKLKKK